MVSAVDVHDFARRGRKPIRQQRTTCTSHSRRIVNVPSQRCARTPQIFELGKRRNRLGCHRANGAGSNEVAANVAWAEFASEVAAGGLERRLGDSHPVVRGPRHGVVKVEPDDAAAIGHERNEGIGQRLQRIRRHLHSHGYVFPGGSHEVITQTSGRCKPDRMQNAIHATQVFASSFAHRGHMVGVRYVEFGHMRHGAEFFGGALRDGQTPPGPGQHHRRTLLLGQLGYTKCQRRVRQDSGDNEPLTFQNRHVATVVDMSSSLPSIGYLGGTGPAGSALAARLASVGYPGFIGSRTPERGQEVASELVTKWASRQLNLAGGDNAAAAQRDVIVLATPWDSAATTVTEHAEALRGKVVITMANALIRVGKEFQPLIPPRGSIAAHVQAAIPASHVVAAFQHLPAIELGALDHDVDSDVLICSDNNEATKTVSDIVAHIAGCRPLNAGLLSNALAIEALTAVLLQLNVRYKTRVAPRFTGIN